MANEACSSFSMITTMLEIFQYDFMIRAFVAGIAVGVVAPLIGMFLVVRRYSLMADTLAHVSLIGVAVSVLTGIHPVLAAVCASVLAAFGVERLRRSSRLFGESLLALFLSGSLAIATVLVGLAKGFNANLLSVLFGNITTVAPVDVVVIVILAVGVLLTILLLLKEFFLVSFDEELAQASGLRASALGTLLVVLAAVTVALSMRIVGVLLIGALMVIPSVTAMQLGRSFRETLFLSVSFSLISVIAGLFLSYYVGLPSGGTIVVIALGLFLVSTVFRSR